MSDGHCHGHCCSNDSEEKASQTHAAQDVDGEEAGAGKTATSSQAASLKDLERKLALMKMVAEDRSGENLRGSETKTVSILGNAAGAEIRRSR